MFLRPTLQTRLLALILVIAGNGNCQIVQNQSGSLTGTVLAQNGTPLAGIQISGSHWTCCPPRQDTVTTDKNGSFHIEHPGTVLHILSSDGLLQQVLVVALQTHSPQIIVKSPSTSVSVVACDKPRPGVERIGRGANGLQFDVPEHEVKLIRGKPDVDYVVHIAKAKSGKDSVEFWFGPYAIDPMPDDKHFAESATFSIRYVVRSAIAQSSGGGVMGNDVSGRQPNGNRWRHTAFGSEGASYENVLPKNAAAFDRIIDSACWVAAASH